MMKKSLFVVALAFCTLILVACSNAKKSSTNSTVSSTAQKTDYKYNLIVAEDKAKAKAGDTINYTLAFYNLGSKDLTDVVIKDKLPARVSLASDVNLSGNVVGIKKLDDLFANGAELGKVPADGTVKVTFSAKINKFATSGVYDLTNTCSATTKEKLNESSTKDNRVGVVASN